LRNSYDPASLDRFGAYCFAIGNKFGEPPLTPISPQILADLDNELVQRRRLERHSRRLAGGCEVLATSWEQLFERSPRGQTGAPLGLDFGSGKASIAQNRDQLQSLKH
jgi:hypothetical protein